MNSEVFMNLKNIKWNKQNYQLYLKYLLSIGETSYALFSSHLTETKYQFIGIRIPQLRMIAKEYCSLYNARYYS
jgi:hypothetical protein